MDFHIASALRHSMADMNLAYPYRESLKGQPGFMFDLNQGPLYSVQDPETVSQVIQIARQYADSESYGEHNALLQLVAQRADFEKEDTCIYWHRAYHVGAAAKPQIWITLEEWLSEKGKKYVPQGAR